MTRFKTTFQLCLFCTIIQSAYVCLFSSITVNPFETWQDSVPYRSLEQLGVPENVIDRAIYNFGQGSFRVWKIFEKVLAGHNIRLAVIGGSNSAGGGMSDHKQLYHQLFAQWWNHAILLQTGSKLIVDNLSLGGTGSNFFSLCLQNYISKGKEPDVVVIEL